MGSSFDFMSQQSNIPEGYPSVPQQYVQTPSNYYNNASKIEKAATDNKPDYSKYKPLTDDNNSNSHSIEKPSASNDLPAVSHRERKKKDSLEDVNDLVKVNGTVVDTPTISSYYETSNMLTTAMQQIDAVAGEIKQELDSVRSSRTMHNKYNTIVGLAGNISDLLEAKVGAIRELNNCISKSNDLDYKRLKDRKDAEGIANDDKRVMDLYNAFVKNPVADTSMSNALGPNAMDTTVYGNNGFVRVADAPVGSNSPDSSFVNYVAKMTPEQNAMLYEQNPDIKQCVVFDAATGNKWFQVMNITTGQVIPNAPVHDQMFMEDTTLDIKNRIAKNINLNESYPLIILNDNVAKNY